MIRECRSCTDKVECVPVVGMGPETRRATPDKITPWTRDNRRWFHIDGDMRGTDGHFANPKPQCPNCDSFDYIHDTTDPWANYTRCGACGHVDRVSLGD